METFEAGPIDFSLAGKVVVLTEAQPDDSLGLPLFLAHAGADLALTSPRPDELIETVDHVRTQGGRCQGYHLDFSKLETIDSAVDSIVRDFGRIDVLVNSVGYNVWALAVDVKPDDWAKIVQLNMTGPFFCAQAVGRHMTAAHRGRIINVGTHSAMRAGVRRTAYGSARAGMVQFTRNLALEWAPYGVSVNSVAPDYLKRYNVLAYPLEAEQAQQKNPMGRLATEAEIAAAIIFLGSDAASFITGQVILVDGGSSL